MSAAAATAAADDDDDDDDDDIHCGNMSVARHTRLDSAATQRMNCM